MHGCGCSALTDSRFSIDVGQIKLLLLVHPLQCCCVCWNQAFKLSVRNEWSAGSLVTHANN